MKTLIASALTVLALNATAASIPVYETSTYERVELSYGINEEMGRAWLELAVYSSTTTDDSGPSYERVKVEGMSLVGGSVVLNVDGQQVECAKVKPVGIFRYRVAKPTGNCKLTSKVETRIQDDGFETRRTKVQIISLTTR